MKRGDRFLLVPEAWLEEITEQQERILKILQNPDSGNQTLEEFIPETEAKKLIKKKSTWFWQARKNGMLPFTKIGRTIYYSRNDILSLFKTTSNETQE